MEEVKLGGIVVTLVFRSMVAEEVVELAQRRRKIGAADAVDDVDALIGVEMVELEVITLAYGVAVSNTHLTRCEIRGGMRTGGGGQECEGEQCRGGCFPEEMLANWGGIGCFAVRDRCLG